MHSVEISHRDIVLLLVSKAPDGIMGKKALQKSLYFLSQNHRLFHFRWADYGPFSDEIQQIDVELRARDKIVITMIPTKKPGIAIHKMTFSPERNESFGEIEFPTELEKDASHVAKFIKGRTPRELELLASVHYWAKRLEDGYTVESVFQKLDELKPYCNFTLDDVKRAIPVLEEYGYLP